MTRMHSLAIMFLQAGLVWFSFTAFAEEQSQAARLGPFALSIKTELQARMVSAGTKTEKNRLASIREYYANNNFRSVWMENGKPTQRAVSLVEALQRAGEDGLDPEEYGASALHQKMGIAGDNRLAELEVHLSSSLVAMAQHLNSGRLNPKSVTRENVIYPDKISAEKILKDGGSTISLKAYLRLLAPHTPRYERLRVALAGYRAIGEKGGWPVIPKGTVLKPGMVDERVPLIRKRLAVSGDFNGPTTNPSMVYDPDLENSVKYFQARHGLAIDGVIGGNTLAQINVPVEERIAIMEYNLERRRWMQDDYGRYYVFANLADQVLKIVRDEKTLHAELIQVGLPYHRTPVFTDEMEYIEINPYWNVPKSIAINELLPKLQSNPASLAAQNYEVLSGNSVLSPTGISWGSYSKASFPFRLRQRPGDGNALGRIKFMFPNNYNIYIHDTPSKSKFNSASRFFSHGCLRLKDPLKMAEIILSDQGWSRAKIDSVVASKKRTVVKLDTKIPVHIAYMTAWVNKDGSVHFRRDVYGRDKILGKALKRAGG